MDPQHATQLKTLALESIQHGLRYERPLQPDHSQLSAVLLERRACFVTLTRQQQLRGCIGTLEAWRVLAEDVTENAYAAAFRDPRFIPLGEDELVDLQVSISILEVPQPLTVSSEQALLDSLRPGIDGLILEAHGHRATFLPAVWESLPDAEAFVMELKRKAGWPGDYWSEEIRCWRYGVHTV